MLLRNADVIKSIGEFFRKTLEPCPALHGRCNGDQIGMLRCQLAEDLSEDLGIGRSFLLWNLPAPPRLHTEWNDAVKLGRVHLRRRVPLPLLGNHVDEDGASQLRDILKGLDKKIEAMTINGANILH